MPLILKCFNFLQNQREADIFRLSRDYCGKRDGNAGSVKTGRLIRVAAGQKEQDHGTCPWHLVALAPDCRAHTENSSACA